MPGYSRRKRGKRVIARFHVDDDTDLTRLANAIARKLRLGLGVRVDVPGRWRRRSERPSWICDKIISLLMALVKRGRLKKFHLDRVRFE